MKRLFLVLSLMVALNYSAFSQEESSRKASDVIKACLPEMGKDTSCVLNDCESKYLNMAFQDLRGNFDFTGKRVAFFTGLLGGTQISKVEYFDDLKMMWNSGNIIHDSTRHVPRDPTRLFIFDEDDAKQVGYDAVVFQFSLKKGVLSKREVIRRLHPGKGIAYLFSRLSYWL